MEASLVLVRSDGATREMSLSSGRIVIGRSKECEVRVPAAAVSRRHCEIEVSADRLLLRDLGSRNGTFVNCQRISEQELNPGDLIAVGPAVLVVRINGEPESIDALDAYEDGMPSEIAVGGSSPTAARTPGGDPEATPSPSEPDPDDSDEFNIDFDALLSDDEDEDEDQPTL